MVGYCGAPSVPWGGSMLEPGTGRLCIVSYEHGGSSDGDPATPVARLAEHLVRMPIEAVLCPDTGDGREVGARLAAAVSASLRTDSRLSELPNDVSGSTDGSSAAGGLDEARGVLASLAREFVGATVVLALPCPAARALVYRVLAAEPGATGDIEPRDLSLTEVEIDADGTGVLWALNRDASSASQGGQALRARGGDADSRCRIILIRQGEAEATDPLCEDAAARYRAAGLSSNGRAELDELMRRWRCPLLETVYAGGATRSVETAEIIARGHHASVVVEPHLEEGVGRRSAAGARVSVAFDAVREAFTRIAEVQAGRTAAIVGHPWVVQPLLAAVAGLDPRSLWRMPIERAAINIVEIDAAGRRAIAMVNGRPFESSGARFDRA